MKRESAFLMVLLIVLVTGSSAALGVLRVEASGTIYIRADGSIDPSTAPISTADNVTYILTGNITSDAVGIVVERDNIVVDGSGFTVEGTQGYDSHGINLDRRINVTIQNIEIKNFDEGIWLHYSSNNSISGNNITNNGNGIELLTSSNYNSVSGNNITANGEYGIWHYGIWLAYSTNNRISGNNITDNEYIGIDIDASSNNTLSGNNVTANGDGIVLRNYSNNNSIGGNNITDNNGTGIELRESSNYNTINENTITNGVCGIWLHSSSNNNSVSGNTFTDAGLSVWDSYSNTVENNTVNGRPLVYLEGMADFSVSDAGQVILVRCDRIRVENLNLSRASFGVQLRETSNSIVSGNNITASNGFAIALDCSSNNSVSGNSILNNSNYGILLMSSTNNRISGNNITNDGLGIGLDSSNYNRVSGNNITNNTSGIWLYDTHNNSINGNNIRNNYYGFSFRFSFNNDVFHNDFINNTVQVNDYLEPEQANFWDNGCEGNYWSDYNGTDLDNDGVGDDYLPWEGVDGYPLMNVYWNPCDIDHDLEVNRTDIDISARVYGTGPGDTLWNPHADITGLEQLVSDGKVDMRDIGLIARHFGEHYP